MMSWFNNLGLEKGPEPMSETAKAVPETGPRKRFAAWQQMSEGEAASRTAYALERIADALEAGPTLRDQMAMAAMQIVFQSVGDNAAPEVAYHVADAMLAARDKKNALKD